MSLDKIDNAELLTADEIEERLADTRTKIENIDYRTEILKRSPAISDKDCDAQIREVSKNLGNLQIDLEAYQTALDAVPEDYD
ncbi:MAG: hypothetical protein Q8N63_01645 [Nanoarchaeota archaeon]|nr:hypothetical protein [Nanoarchaeota archaeon]